MPVRMDYQHATSSLPMHGDVVKAVRQEIAQQVDVPLSAVGVTLSLGGCW